MKSNATKSVLERLPWMATVLQWIFCFEIIAILIPEGSVQALPLYLLAIPLFIAAALVACLGMPARQHKILHHLATGVAVTIALWSAAQAVRLEDNPFANPVWRAAGEVLGPLGASISIVPGDTVAAVVPVLMPFAIFLSALVLFPSDRAALSLLRFLAVFGGLVAAYGIVQYELFPQYLMFRKKEFYLDDLTSVLVNRNSIATYIGAALLLNAGFLYDSVLPAAPVKGWGGNTFYARNHFRITGHTVAHALLLLSALVALLLSRSRAGVGATFAAFLPLAIFFIFDGFDRLERRARRMGPRPARLSAIGVAFGAVLAIALGFAFLGSRVLLRADAQGLEDGRFCAYPQIVRLLDDNWIRGTGLGSFRDAFPRYQDPSCGNNLWDRAHSFYLEGWIDLGVVFVPLLLVTIVGLSLTFLTGIRTRKSLRWASAAGWSILLLFLLHSIVDFSIQIPGVATTFAAIMAATSLLSLNRKVSSTVLTSNVRPSEKSLNVTSKI